MIEFRKKLQAQFDLMCQTGVLFSVALSGREIWDMYLASFDNDPVFRDPSSSTHNCNTCNSFIRRYANIVAIGPDMKLMSIFDVEADEEYQHTANVLAEAIKSSNIVDVFVETDKMLEKMYGSFRKGSNIRTLGVESNTKQYNAEEAAKYGVVAPGSIRKFEHMALTIPADLIYRGSKSAETIQAEHRSNFDVFYRGMTTIPVDTLELVRDLIDQESLLDGKTHRPKLMAYLALAKEFAQIHPALQYNWAWKTSYGLKIAKFRNELIGVLCTELAEGKDLNEACAAWNRRVDPVNYMKTKAPITQKQIEEAQNFVIMNGYTESFDRRFATIDDIAASDILHMNIDAEKAAPIALFAGVQASSSTRHKRTQFDNVEQVTIENFMTHILPTVSSVEVYLENRHEGNFASLITANIKNSRPLFKYPNNYSKTYNGDLAGKSMIKQAVKDAGGNVEGVLNFRLAWNDEAPYDDGSDLDLWAREPNNQRIGFSAGFRKDEGNRRTSMSGQLDVDNRNPNGKIAVENITWTDLSKMVDGIYKVWVNQYSARNTKGFKMEIAFGDETYTYTYNQPVYGDIQVAEVTLKSGQFSIRHILPVANEDSGKEIYGLETGKFHKVNLVCLSPSHWQQPVIGNKHYFFFLEGAQAPIPVRSFHIEDLRSELLEHKRVLEVLGTTTKIPVGGKQLSGLGFNATVRDEVVVKLKGSFQRTIKIIF